MAKNDVVLEVLRFELKFLKMALWSFSTDTLAVILGIRPPARSIGLLTHVSHSTAQNIVAYATCPVLTVRG